MAQSPTGVDAGGFGLSIRAEELAAFGQLLLQRGRWKGRQLVSAECVDLATSRQVSNGTPTESSDWGQGYGFQFWMCRHGAYRGDGAFGQYVVVLPEHDAVVTMTGGLPDMQQPLDALWATLLPAFDTVEPAAEVPAPRPIATVGGERARHRAGVRVRRPHRGSCGSRDGLLGLDGSDVRFAPDEWVLGRMQRRPGRRPAVVRRPGRRVRRLARRQFVVELRMLEDAVTFRLEVTASGHLTITRDVGFDGTEVWEGDPRPAEPEAARALAAYVAATNTHDFAEVEPLLASECVYYFGDATRRGTMQVRDYFEDTWRQIVDEVYEVRRRGVGAADTGCRDRRVPLHAGAACGTADRHRARGGEPTCSSGGMAEWLLVHEHLSPLP